MIDRDFPVQPYWQGALMKQYGPANRDGETEGVCFRLAFKWLACRIYGRQFKFGYEKGTTLPSFKQSSVLKKQRKYLEPIAPVEGKGKEYVPYFLTTNRAPLSTLQAWGNKDKTSAPGTAKYRLQFGYTACRSLVGRKEFDQEAGMIIGVYGITHNAGPWAHATAFHRRRPGGPGSAQELAFFDANGGEFQLDPSSDTGAEIGQYLEHHYSGIDGTTCYAIKDYVLYRVTAS